MITAGLVSILQSLDLPFVVTYNSTSGKFVLFFKRGHDVYECYSSFGGNTLPKTMILQHFLIILQFNLSNALNPGQMRLERDC